MICQQAGKLASDNSTGRYLLDLVTGVPQIEVEKFEDMLNSNMKVRKVKYWQEYCTSFFTVQLA